MPVHARTFDRDKALEAILYIAHRLPSPTLHGISKMCYLADKRHLERYGRLICGDRYVAMEYGPVPSTIYDMMKVADGRENLDPDTDALIMESFAVRAGRNIKPRRKANIDVLAKSEIECFDFAIRKYGKKTFGQLTDLTHDDAWNSVDQDKPISIEAMARTLPNAADLIAHLRA